METRSRKRLKTFDESGVFYSDIWLVILPYLDDKYKLVVMTRVAKVIRHLLATNANLWDFCENSDDIHLHASLSKPAIIRYPIRQIELVDPYCHNNKHDNEWGCEKCMRKFVKKLPRSAKSIPGIYFGLEIFIPN